MGETAYAGQPQGIAPTIAQDGMGETADTGQPQGIAPTVAQIGLRDMENGIDLFIPNGEKI